MNEETIIDETEALTASDYTKLALAAGAIIGVTLSVRKWRGRKSKDASVEETGSKYHIDPVNGDIVID
jgi:hypothetical protein